MTAIESTPDTEEATSPPHKPVLPEFATSPQAQEIFAALRELLRKWERPLVVQADEPGNYSLITAHIMPNKQPLWFGAVQIKKRYISYHLIPVYGCPALLDDISPQLRARMQGKSCFNFTKPDAALFAELATLTDRGFDGYRTRGYVAL